MLSNSSDWLSRPLQEATHCKMHVCVCHLIDIGVLLAELPFVLHDGFQVRKIFSDLQRSKLRSHIHIGKQTMKNLCVQLPVERMHVVTQLER